MSGVHVALSVFALIEGRAMPSIPSASSFDALLRYATDPATIDYQPMHVNFGIMPPLPERVGNKRLRYAAYAARGAAAFESYVVELKAAGLL